MSVVSIYVKKNTEYFFVELTGWGFEGCRRRILERGSSREILHTKAAAAASSGGVPTVYPGKGPASSV
jgi:hypothetical protein